MLDESRYKRTFKRRELEYELKGEGPNNYGVLVDGRYLKVFRQKRDAEKVVSILVKQGIKAKVSQTAAGVTEDVDLCLENRRLYRMIELSIDEPMNIDIYNSLKDSVTLESKSTEIIQAFKRLIKS